MFPRPCFLRNEESAYLEIRLDFLPSHSLTADTETSPPGAPPRGYPESPLISHRSPRLDTFGWRACVRPSRTMLRSLPSVAGCHPFPLKELCDEAGGEPGV